MYFTNYAHVCAGYKRNILYILNMSTNVIIEEIGYRQKTMSIPPPIINVHELICLYSMKHFVILICYLSRKQKCTHKIETVMCLCGCGCLTCSAAILHTHYLRVCLFLLNIEQLRFLIAANAKFSFLGHFQKKNCLIDLLKANWWNTFSTHYNKHGEDNLVT